MSAGGIEIAFYPELAARSLQDLVRDFDSGSSPADAVPDDELPLWLSEVALAIAEHGQAGLDALLQRVYAADEDRLRGILLGLSSVKGNLREAYRPRLQSLLLSYLDDSRPDVVAEAVDALAYLDGKDARERVLPLLAHPSPYVVGSALRYLAKHFPKEARPALLRGLESPEPLVRQNAVDELDEMEDVEALPHLRRLLTDADADVRLAARTAVSNLEDLPNQDKGR